MSNVVRVSSARLLLRNNTASTNATRSIPTSHATTVRHSMKNLVDRSETVPHMANIRNALTASVRTTVKNRTVIAMTGPNAANSVPMKNAPVHPVLSAINHPTAADTTGTIEPMEIVTSTTTVRTGITLLANSKNDLTTAARKNTVTNSTNRRTPDSRSARNDLHLIRNTIPINKRGRFV